MPLLCDEISVPMPVRTGGGPVFGISSNRNPVGSPLASKLVMVTCWVLLRFSEKRLTVWKRPWVSGFDRVIWFLTLDGLQVQGEVMVTVFPVRVRPSLVSVAGFGTPLPGVSASGRLFGPTMLPIG